MKEKEKEKGMFCCYCEVDVTIQTAEDTHRAAERVKKKLLSRFSIAIELIRT